MRVFIDNLGQWEMLEDGNEVMLIPLSVRWPDNDLDFLILARIKFWDKVPEREEDS